MTDDDKHHFNHPQCHPCWLREWGFTREPVRVKNDPITICCFCGRRTSSGIYRRERPGSPLIAYCPDRTGVFRAAPAHAAPPPPTGPQASSPAPSPPAPHR